MILQLKGLISEQIPPTERKLGLTEKYKTLLIGGHGTIGSGLRKYLPSLNDSYKIVSLDLPGSRDKAGLADAQRDAVEFDLSKSPGELKSLIQNFDLVVYLARKSPLDEMNAMTDVVFEAVLAQEQEKFPVWAWVLTSIARLMS